MSSVLVALLSVTACGSEGVDDPDGPDPDGPGDRSDEVFAPDRLLRIDITVDDADWDALRFQERTITDIFGGECLAEPFPKPYTYFPATVAIDGEVVADIGLRKKGFLGSLSREKPSLKLKFDEYVPDQRYMGMKRMTLNNARQDPSLINQCVGYQLFAEAGVPAPRCNFAVVSVNGVELGVYAHVESVKKPFLRRHFADDGGDLYEGTLSDFRPEWKHTFERKTNESDPPGSEDRGDIDALVALMDVPDAELESAVGAEVDLDAFYTFWAMEVILGHWDGYASNTNNFFIYRDPTTDTWQFLPWGIDALLYDENPFGTPAGATGVFATGALARRLYMNPPTRARYVDRVVELLDTVWNETAIAAEIDRMRELVSPHVTADARAAFEDGVDSAREFVLGRRAGLLGVLQPTPPAWTEPLRDPFCIDTIGDAAIEFQTTWGTLEQGTPFSGTASFDVTVNGEPLAVTAAGVLAGFGEDTRGLIAPLAALEDGTTAMAYIETDVDRIHSGAQISLDHGEATGYLLRLLPGDQVEIIGMLAGGAVLLEQAGTSPGDPLIGRVDAVVYETLF